MAAACFLGYTIDKITVLPVGINGRINENILNKTHNFIIAASGPCVNLVIALIASYFGLYDVAICNIYMLVFNLLPILPLDGGRIFVSFYENEHLNRIMQFLAYAVIIIVLLLDFLNNCRINVSLVWVLLFTCDLNNNHTLKANIKTEIIMVSSEIKIFELLKKRNCDFLVYEGNVIVGILKYEDIYNAAVDGLYYFNTKELITERIKNGHPRIR